MGTASNDDSGAPSDEGIGRRTKSRNRVVEWVLVDGDRLLVTFLGSAAVFVVLVVLYQAGVIAFSNDASITRMAGGMIAGTFSLVTLVVSVNQLILSQEFSPAGQYRDRLGGVLQFRRDVEGATGVPASPASPTRLLELLTAAIHDRAGTLADVVGDHGDREFRDRTVRYADSIQQGTERIHETLEQGGVSAFDALSAAIKYDEGWQLYAARHLRNDTDGLSAEADIAFDDLIEVLRLFSTAQEHFKTIYLQRELTRFSQLTIYAGVPAILAASLVILIYGDLGGIAIDIKSAPYVTSLLVAVVFVPLMLLASYILRTATVTHRTSSIGPMLPEEGPDEGPFDVSYDEEN
jgi:Na+-transporting methylmalonyl-CoA/oxaloacetate decarboxylase gamma subunit